MMLQWWENTCMLYHLLITYHLIWLNMLLFSCTFSALYISAFLMMFVYVLATGVGLVIYAYYHQAGCDPLRAGHITSQNQVHVSLLI